jgi:hypothetical protein
MYIEREKKKVRNEGVNEIGGLAGPSANWSLISLDLDSVFLLPDLPHSQQQGFNIATPTQNILYSQICFTGGQKKTSCTVEVNFSVVCDCAFVTYISERRNKTTFCNWSVGYL